MAPLAPGKLIMTHRYAFGCLTGLGESILHKLVGQAILPAAAFQAAYSGRKRVFASGERRLKAGGSQDWLPHKPSSPDLPQNG
jgi:hypothetical protein